MRQHTLKYLLAIFSLACCGTVFGAASDVVENPELENARALLQAGRAEIIREDLRMTDDESEGFWAVYEKYHDEIMTIRDRHAVMVAGFLQAYREGAFTDEFAEDLIDDHFEIKRGLLKVQMKYVSKFRKVLPAIKVARFYQLENKMDAEVDAQLGLVIPLIE